MKIGDIAIGTLVCGVIWYAVRVAGGWEVRRGENQYILAWLHNKTVEHRLRHLYIHYQDLVTRGILELARRYDNDGAPFIVLNLDHYGWPAWWLGHRLRRLIDRTATREHIPVFPIPFTPWMRADRSPAVFSLIERRRHECVFTRETKRGTDYFLSGFNRNERWPGLYFLTQLPRPVTSIDDAREALKPPSVVAAEQDGRKVYRQGDMFAVATKITSEDIAVAGGAIDRLDWRSLYGTAHTADVVASLPDGTQLAWGRLYHKPRIIGARRDPDHRPLKLKRGRWHLVAKNMTPMCPPSE